MVLKLGQSAVSGVKHHVSSIPARPVVPVQRAKQSIPAKRLSTVMRVAEMERTAQDDALMFCYQVSMLCWPPCSCSSVSFLTDTTCTAAVLDWLQCEQTKGNVGCDKVGVCGKTPQVAILQDLLIYQLKVSLLLWLACLCWGVLRLLASSSSSCGARQVPVSIHSMGQTNYIAHMQCNLHGMHMGFLAVLASCADLLLCCVLVLQGLGAWASFAHQITNLPTPEVDSFVKAAIFSTLTNVSQHAVSCSRPPLVSLLLSCAGSCCISVCLLVLCAAHLHLSAAAGLCA